MSIIELKKNKRPLILMNSELQAAMLSMTPEDFLCLQDTSSLNDQRWTPVDSGGDWCVDSNLCNTFRLRSDYEEKPEIVECEIYEQEIYENGGRLRFGAGGHSIDYASGHPDFIGFKFEDGSWHDQPIKPVNRAGQLIYGDMSINEIISGRVIILHATHVLFRGSK